MLKVPTLVFHCPHCSKPYRRKRDFDLHCNTCRIINEDISEKEVELRQDTMTHHQLCDVVKMLVKEQLLLKEQVKGLQKQLATIRKKVTVEDYLSQQVHPICGLTQFGSRLRMSRDDFITLLESKLDDVLDAIVNRVCPDIDEVPMRTFVGNGGIVYCYDIITKDKVDEKNQCSERQVSLWRKMTESDWQKLSGHVSKSLLERLKEWTDENQRRLTSGNDDSFSLRYNTYVQKIMCCIPRIQQKLTNLLCQRVKVSLNSVTTFEFKLS